MRRLCRWRQYKWENDGQLTPNEAERESFSFNWGGSPTLDRRQDAQTDAIILENNLASPTTIFANNGLDYEKEMQQAIDDKNLLAKMQQGDTPNAQPVASENKLDVKQMIEAYGGTITPQQTDENHFRGLLGLPPVEQPVLDAWEADGGARRPITLKSQDAFEAEENDVIDTDPVDEIVPEI